MSISSSIVIVAYERKIIVKMARMLPLSKK